jgi:hypothetical protein
MHGRRERERERGGRKREREREREREENETPDMRRLIDSLSSTGYYRHYLNGYSVYCSGKYEQIRFSNCIVASADVREARSYAGMGQITRSQGGSIEFGSLEVEPTIHLIDLFPTAHLTHLSSGCSILQNRSLVL